MWYDLIVLAVGMLLAFYMGAKLTKQEPLIPNKRLPEVIDFNEEESIEKLIGEGKQVGTYNGEKEINTE
ncbi:MAG: hypothetical protein ACYST3_04990 [Planctomycetota bacterium]